MTRFFPQGGIDFPLLIPEESGEVVERPGRRETWFSCWPSWLSTRAPRASVFPSISQQPGAMRDVLSDLPRYPGVHEAETF